MHPPKGEGAMVCPNVAARRGLYKIFVYSKAFLH